MSHRALSPQQFGDEPQRTWREDFPHHDVPREISGIEGMVDRSSIDPDPPIGPQFMRDWGKEGEPGHHRVKVIVAHPDPKEREESGYSGHARFHVLYHTNESDPSRHVFPSKFPEGQNPMGMTDLYSGEDPKEAARTTINAVVQTHRHLRENR